MFLYYFRFLGYVSQHMLARKQTKITNLEATFLKKWRIQTKFDITSAHITDSSRITAPTINQAPVRTNQNNRWPTKNKKIWILELPKRRILKKRLNAVWAFPRLLNTRNKTIRNPISVFTNLENFIVWNKHSQVNFTTLWDMRGQFWWLTNSRATWEELCKSGEWKKKQFPFTY